MTTHSRPQRQPRDRRLQTIGAVCRRLKAEFPDISISKIRYLEEQGLIAPKRTPGGYRLFDETDVERLERVLRLQRDEFLPLRVIRQELTAPSQAREPRRRRIVADEAPDGDTIDLGTLCERAGITQAFARELEEFGLLEGRGTRGARRFTQADVEVAALCLRLSRFGMSGRHLRTFRTTADREAALLTQVLAPGLHARSAERRHTALEELQDLAEVSQELSRTLFWRDLARLATE